MDGAPLHVGLVAPLWHPVAPDRGGVEQIVFLLARELVAMGHRVTLIASGDSAPVGRLVPVCPQNVVAAMEAGLASDYSLFEAAAVAHAIRVAPELDLLHSHLGTRLVPLSPLIGAPVLHTLHTSVSADMRWLLEQFPGRSVSVVSRWQAAALGGDDVPVVPNGVDLDAFPLARVPGEHLLVLGRVEPRKGVDVAIEVARASGLPLVIAGHVVDRAYFAERVRPHVDGERVRYLGPVAGAAKIDLLQRARGLVFPVQWEEAFGIVMVEAMACGTPVLALARGAVPEIVVQGENGFHAREPGELVPLVARLGGLDRARVRASVERRFSHRRMVAGYVDLYRRVCADAAADKSLAAARAPRPAPVSRN
jgi:glycosyltransferase involved in cell wall biosynthesis